MTESTGGGAADDHIGSVIEAAAATEGRKPEEFSIPSQVKDGPSLERTNLLHFFLTSAPA